MYGAVTIQLIVNEQYTSVACSVKDELVVHVLVLLEELPLANSST